MKWINRNLITIIAIVLFIANCVFYGLSIYEKDIFIGLIASIATLYLGIIKYKIESDKFSLELFKSFNDRYNDELNDIFNSSEVDEIKKLSEKERLTVIDYINLCAEEYYWYKKDRISDKVWKAWSIGIKKNLYKKNIQEIYADEIEKYRGSFYELEKEFPPFPSPRS
jgi:hypothetical protein